MRETSASYVVGDKMFEFYTEEPKYIRKVNKLCEKFPEIRIINQDGEKSMLAYLPLKFFKISPPVQRNMSNEQKEALRERLAKVRSERG